MICPVEIASDVSALQAARVGEHGRYVLLHAGRDGADHEGTRSDFAGASEEDHVVAGGRDHRDQRPANEAWHEGYEEFGFRGLFDRRRGKPSPKKVPLAVVEKVLGLYREKYFDLNVRHFPEKLQEEHQVEISYSWVKGLLQGAGMVAKGRKRGVHRQQRPRRPLPGMLLHIDGSEHRWFQDERWYDLLVIMDDANSEIYYAQLVEEEATVPVLTGLKEVVECRGVFCALYSDRARHFWLTAKAGEAVEHDRLTQVGRALRELGVRMIPAYSPQARGRSERSFGTWQGRLPQELRLRGIRTVVAANAFLREQYIGEFNRRFQVEAAQPGSAFVPYRGKRPGGVSRQAPALPSLRTG